MLSTKVRVLSSRSSTWKVLSGFLVLGGASLICAGQSLSSDEWVSPIEGKSLLGRMGRQVDRSSLGRNGLLSSRVRSALVARSPSTGVGRWLTKGFELDGEDLYRINCRSCHRAGGEGLPPEVSPILDPVRASSPEQIEAQMASRGRKMSRALAERMAARAQLAIRHRLEEGGEVMAPFSHLQPPEVDALLEHLEALAGVAETGATRSGVQQDAARVGEHVAKAICHICHDAVRGVRRGDDSDLPALAEIPLRYSIADVVQKVRRGTVGQARTRGRMPLFPYLTEEEIAAAYVYLSAFPPIGR